LYLGVLAERPSDWRHPLYLAQVQVKLGKLAEAKKHLLMTVNLKDDVAIAWGTLGEVALRENQLELALQHIARARALDPRDMLWRLVEARALKRKGKPEEALQVLSGASDNDLLQQGVVTTMVECYGLLQRPLDAAKLYAKLSDLLGDRGDFALEAARWFTRAGDNASARKYAQHAQYLGVAEAKELLSATP
jgi:predicted Zn-dependent protease